MNKSYRVVQLLKNQLYPTYQLHAYMANKKTAPQDGLRLAGLIVIDWLRQRLGENTPEELQRVPEPSAYLECWIDALTSMHINHGYVVDIVSLPEQGLWTLQVTEPDLGSDPGNPKQVRQPIPGRVIETNIGFRVIGSQLECGFQTVISDPEGTVPMTEVYRLSVVRRLGDHPSFGLLQNTPLSDDVLSISTVEQLKALVAIWKDEENHLPCVVFTHLNEQTSNVGQATVPQLTISPLTMPSSQFLLSSIPSKLLIQTPKNTVSKLPYDIESFSHHGMGFCRTYLLSDGLFQRALSQLKCSAQPGDILVLDPTRFAGEIRVLPYKPNAKRQEETIMPMRKFTNGIWRMFVESRLFPSKVN